MSVRLHSSAPRIPPPRKTRTRAPPPAPVISPSGSIALVVLKRAKARLFRGDGSCLVYAGAVERTVPKLLPEESNVKSPVRAADAVAVLDGAGGLLGFGFYNPFSMFAVRIVQHIGSAAGAALPDFDAPTAIGARVHAAVKLRRSLGLPSQDTTAFRAINGEGDRLSGLSCDVFGNVAVVVSGAIWVERYREEISAALLDALVECGVCNEPTIVWRMAADRLRQDGAPELDVEEAEELIPSLAPFAKGAAKDAGEPRALQAEDVEKEFSGEVIVKEHGMEFLLPRSALVRGQKTGMYADQRDNRLALRSLLARRSGASVLDCYCYSGGFAIAAALGGAGAVHAVDSSAAALEMARVNAVRNGVTDSITFEQGDVPSFLISAAERGDSYDIVVLDPPKLAPSSKAASLDRAASKYRSVNAAALKVISPGGLLLTCSCSAAMCRDRDLFVATVRKAASFVGREVALLQISGAGADHPVDLSEGASGGYLSAFLFAVR